MRISHVAVVATILLFPSWAMAGMPTVVITDVVRTYRLTEPAEMRVQAISFFLVVLLACTLVVRWLWNSLRSDFPKLPRLTFGKASAVVMLWGLLFLAVLTMIAATREMMTPGSWQKQGLLYTVADDAPPTITPMPTGERP